LNRALQLSSFCLEARKEGHIIKKHSDQGKKTGPTAPNTEKPEVGSWKEKTKGVPCKKKLIRKTLKRKGENARKRVVAEREIGHVYAGGGGVRCRNITGKSRRTKGATSSQASHHDGRKAGKRGPEPPKHQRNGRKTDIESTESQTQRKKGGEKMVSRAALNSMLDNRGGWEKMVLEKTES